MAYTYKRRRPSLVRNFWVYRRLIGLAMILGLLLWFIWANGERVTVAFPFGLGQFTSTTGLVILLSALVGSVVTALAMTIFFALRLRKGPGSKSVENESSGTAPDDLPPPDYASKTTEGFPDSRWS
jgi:uncharacterized integral membrane protein